MNKNQSVIPLGREAFNWLQAGGSPTQCGPLKSLSYRWNSYWFERHLAMQRRLNPVTSSSLADPVFVLGLWRAGTTFLHDLMNTIPGLISPTTRECMNSASFRLVPATSSASINRPMDDRVIHTNSPQEDEFALLALGVPSVYRCFIDPRRMEEMSYALDLDFWTADQPNGWSKQWQEFLFWVTQSHGMTAEDRLLLKSPNHTFRIRAIHEIFPKSSYVLIVRCPQEIYFSNQKMWTAMFQQYSLWNWDLHQLDEFLIKSFKYYIKCLNYMKSNFTHDQLVVIDLMQLAADPYEQLKKITKQLDLGLFEPKDSPLRHQLNNNTEHKINKYTERSIPENLKDVLKTLHKSQQAMLSIYNGLA